jgi:hypothetical protein
MTIKFGLELEGFYSPVTGTVSLPPLDYPQDGFPGLVEFRTKGADSFWGAVGTLYELRAKYPNVNNSLHEHTFTAQQLAQLRKKYRFRKSTCDVQNIYGKKPRLARGKTLASLQISFSKHNYKGEPVLFDFVPFIKRLDQIFANELSYSKRQPGVYAVKDSRVEYRSLPNFVFFQESVDRFCTKVLKAFEE